MKRYVHFLSVQLFAWVFGVVAIVLAAYAFVNLRTISHVWVEAAHERANQASELIKRSTHYSMLLNRKEDVHQMIRRLAEEPGIEGIRIYDKQGTIIFSANTSEISNQVDLQAEACVLCHDQAEPLRSVPSEERMRTYRSPSGMQVLGLISPIENEPACVNSACHAHPADQTVLGVLDVKISLAGLDESMSLTKRQMIGAAVLAAILIALVVGLSIYRLVRVPVRDLVRGTQRVAAGDLTTRLGTHGRGQLRYLAGQFNKMIEDLARARTEITEWSTKLEQKVIEKTDELGRSQRQVVQMDKMASLGKLAASVAHELNNPLAGILNYAKLVGRGIKEESISEEDRKDMLQFLEHIQREASRCGDIVRNLLLFARQSDLTLGEHPLNQIIERSEMVVRHHLQIAGIRFVTALMEGDDTFICDANQIQQALVALLVNAAEAMPDGGTLSISVETENDHAVIILSDTGVGISSEDLPHIFEPYFSTKDKAVGVGLGLAVVFGIIQRHDGQIDVKSDIGKGTTFRITLPRKPEEGTA